MTESPLNALTSRFRPFFVSAAAFSLVLNLLMLVPALFMLQVFDRVLTSRSIETLVMLLEGAGFVDVDSRGFRESETLEPVPDLEERRLETLYAEGTKPGLTSEDLDGS